MADSGSSGGTRGEHRKVEIDPLTKGKIRSGRDDGRPSEDDIAKQDLGEQGIPGQPPKPPILDSDKLQVPKYIDPGHPA
jgi:hypothetical protein